MNSKQANNRYSRFLGYLISIIPLLGVVVFFSCNQSPVAIHPGGSGTGVGNGATIIGRVINDNSIPVEGAMVRLRTNKYLPDTSGTISDHRTDTTASVTTDSKGFFVIDSLKTAKIYYIEVNDDESQSVDVGTLYRVDLIKDTLRDTVELPTRVVKPLKDFEGAIVLNGLPQNAYVQMYGVERIGRTDMNGRFEIDELPVGECERNECEYKLKITVVNKDGTITVYNSELEIKFDKDGNIIGKEFELEDD